MRTQDSYFDDEWAEGSDWHALGWIVLAALVAVAAFLMAPLP